MKAMMLAVAILAAAVAAGAGQDERLSASVQEEYAGLEASAYEVEFVGAQPIWERDFLLLGVGWIFDGADRSKERTETTTTREVVTETVVDPETGAESTTERVVETPTTTTIREPGESYDGLGVFASYPLFAVDGDVFDLALGGGAVVPSEDLQTCWPTVNAGVTFGGGDAGEWSFFKMNLGAALVLDEDMMWGLTLALVK